MAIKSFAASVALVTLLFAGTAKAQEVFNCDNAANQMIAATLKPIIEKAKLCKGLKKKVDTGIFKVKLKVNQTKLVRVESLAFCTSTTSRKIEATIHVECESPEDADVDISLAETFEVAMTVDNKSCKITDFEVEPDGEIGELIAENTDFEDKVREAAQKQVTKLCGSNS
jgi:hypothetical protein